MSMRSLSASCTDFSDTISMAQCKTAVTPLLTHWSYCSLQLSHWYMSHVHSDQEQISSCCETDLASTVPVIPQCMQVGLDNSYRQQGYMACSQNHDSGKIMTVPFHYDINGFSETLTADTHILLARAGYAGLILGLHPANERQRYFVTASLIGWAQA